MAYQILHLDDEARWHGYLDLIAGKQLVHFPRYSRVYQRYGDGMSECFVYEGDAGLVVYPYLRRTIGGAPSLTDIITPYGYGGPVYECQPGRSPAELVVEFRNAFVDYARSTGIVSEFVRFHPMLRNHEHFVGLMDEVQLHCVNALIDLSVGAESVYQNYRLSYRQCIRKASEAGLRFATVPAPDFIAPFFKLYDTIMQRPGQKGYVKFRREFFSQLSDEIKDVVKCFGVFRGDDLVATALFLDDGHFMDYFLAASDVGALSLRPNHLLLHEAALWGIQNGRRWLHLGGGHMTLQFFKQGFANRSCDYYVGKAIYDVAMYNRLSAEHWERHNCRWDKNDPYFPGYRAEFANPQVGA